MKPATLPRSIIPLAALTITAAGAALFFALSASRSNGAPGFPLDDAWIHLQFARNLHDYGSFSYFQDRMVTSGSTSPLYTLLLAAGFFLTSNEMILSYAWGILSHVALVILVFLLMRGSFPGKSTLAGGFALALTAAGLTALEPRLIYASVSGMETNLFTALLVGALLAYRKKRAAWLGVASGLALWARPEAVLFVAALALDLIYDARWREKRVMKKRDAEHAEPRFNVWVFVGLCAAFAVAYGVWNHVLSGTIFPNTMAAKLKYYGSGSADFQSELVRFLTGGHLMPFILLAGVSLINVFVRILRRKSQVYLVHVLWISALTGVYWLKLPHLYQEGRYLMPLLPFVLMLGVDGLELVLTRLEPVVRLPGRGAWRVGVISACGGAIVIQFVAADITKSRGYAESCRYIEDRQVKTARWISSHLPLDAIVATHDVGAVAFYGGRRVVDMVGLVSPGMIRNIGSFEGLQRFLLSQKATHVVVLRNWFEVANQTPLFQTDEQAPEIMEVFSYDPGRTRFISQDVTQAVMTASMLLGAGRAADALHILEFQNRVEPASSRVHYYLAVAAAALGSLDQADRELRAAVRLQPDHWPARILLAEVTYRRGNVIDARAIIDTILAARPEDSAALQVRALISRDTTAGNTRTP